jgi:hypothetical protein
VQILELLRAQAQGGKTVLVVTHNREISRPGPRTAACRRCHRRPGTADRADPGRRAEGSAGPGRAGRHRIRDGAGRGRRARIRRPGPARDVRRPASGHRGPGVRPAERPAGQRDAAGGRRHRGPVHRDRPVPGVLHGRRRRRVGRGHGIPQPEDLRGAVHHAEHRPATGRRSCCWPGRRSPRST